MNVLISLDGDKTGSTRVASLEEVFGKIIHFLPRHMFECYLLHPEALAALLNSLPGFADTKVTGDAVKKWIESEGSNPRYKVANLKPMSPEWWRRSIPEDGTTYVGELSPRIQAG